MQPMLSISLIDGDPNREFARVRISDGRKKIGECYIMTADLMKCITGQMTPVFLTYEEADAARKNQKP